MRRIDCATAVLAALIAVGLALPAAADPEAEAAPAPPQETAEPAEEPAEPAAPAEEVPPFEAPDPADFSVIDPTDPPDPTENLPSPQELEEKAKREAVGRQTEQLQEQSSHGVGKEYFGGGVF